MNISFRVAIAQYVAISLLYLLIKIVPTLKMTLRYLIICYVVILLKFFPDITIEGIRGIKISVALQFLHEVTI